MSVSVVVKILCAFAVDVVIGVGFPIVFVMLRCVALLFLSTSMFMGSNFPLVEDSDLIFINTKVSFLQHHLESAGVQQVHMRCAARSFSAKC